MPRDGAGVFTLVTGNPVSPGTIIESDWANSTLDDIAQALSDSLTEAQYDVLFAASLTLAIPDTNFGTAAYEDIGTSGATVPLLSGINTWEALQTFANFTSPLGNVDTLTAGDITASGSIVAQDVTANEGTFSVLNVNMIQVFEYTPPEVETGTPSIIRMTPYLGQNVLQLINPDTPEGAGLIAFYPDGEGGNAYTVGDTVSSDTSLATKKYVDDEIAALDIPTTSAGLIPIAAGRVTSAAAITSGFGFTVAKTGTGAYTVTLSSPAASQDKCLAMVTPIPSTINDHYSATPAVNSASSIAITTGKGHPWAVNDCGFNLVVYSMP